MLFKVITGFVMLVKKAAQSDATFWSRIGSPINADRNMGNLFVTGICAQTFIFSQQDGGRQGFLKCTYVIASESSIPRTFRRGNF